MKQQHVKWILCGLMPSPKYRLLRPIKLKTYYRDGEWWAETYWMGMWGVGKSRTDAMKDCMTAIVDVYELLQNKPKAAYLDRYQARTETYLQVRRTP